LYILYIFSIFVYFIILIGWENINVVILGQEIKPSIRLVIIENKNHALIESQQVIFAKKDIVIDINLFRSHIILNNLDPTLLHLQVLPQAQAHLAQVHSLYQNLNQLLKDIKLLIINLEKEKS
jgi:hypothetical protein